MTASRVIGLVAGSYLALGALGLSGSSGLVAVDADGLHPGGSQGREVFGTSQRIRQDEWAVESAIARAQQLAEPPFALVNLDVGLGQLARASYTVPVLDWGVAFRPLTWPLLLGSRWSFGIRWFARSALVLLGTFLAMRAAARSSTSADRRGREWIAALAAIAVTYSTAVQWWLSTSLPELLGYSGLAIWAASRQADAPSRRGRLLWLSIALYAMACAFFLFYPPMWAPFLWLVFGALFDRSWVETRSVARAVRALMPMVLGTAAVIGLSIAYYLPYLSLVASTAYPGRRGAEAGALGLDRLLDLAWPSLRILARASEQGLYLGRQEAMNVCEASAVEALPVLALAAAALASGRVRRAFREAIRNAPGSALAWLVLVAWTFVPLPAWVGTATFLRWTPGYRAWFAVGVGTAWLAARTLFELLDAPADRERPIAAGALGAVGLAASLVLALPLVKVPQDPAALVAYAVPLVLFAVLTVAGLASLRARRAPVLLGLAWAVPLVVATMSANPLVRSEDLFATGPGHEVVDRALRETPGRVLDYATHVGSVRAGSGWPVLAAVYVAPDRDLFRYLAPDSPGLEDAVFNRYAHVSFTLPPYRTQLLAADHFRLSIWPCSRRLATLGVNHFIARFSKERLGTTCGDEFTERKAGDLWLWTRREPVSAWGVAPALPWAKSALEFDFRPRAGGDRAVLEKRRTGLTVRVPGDPRSAYAIAINPSVLGDPACVDAFARRVDAHLVVTATSERPGRCDVPYLGTLAAARRLLPGWGTPQAIHAR
jgi:hypothetical protein